MRYFFTVLTSFATTAYAAPALIGTGLLLLLAHPYTSVLPITTALSLIALGATMAMIARSIRSPTLLIRIAIHLFVYASLYLLLVGAICDAAVRESRVGLTLAEVTDLGLSAGIMTFVVQLCIAAIADDPDATTR